MPTDKRQRQKQARQQRQEELRAARIKAARRKSTIRLVVIMVVVVGLLSLFGVFSNKKDKTTVRTSDATKAGPDYGTTPCPPKTGAQERKTEFSSPFKKCIDPNRNYVATMKTDVGVIEIDLNSAQAPLTVNNMVALARYHFYDGVPFHRVIKDFVVQGGDAAKGDGTGGPGFSIKDELPKPSDYKVGSLAMANSGPDTNGSQFFIVTSEAGAKTLVSAAGGKANYTLFGQVASGMDVVKQIEADGSDGGTPAVVHKIVTLTIKEKNS